MLIKINIYTDYNWDCSP